MFDHVKFGVTDYAASKAFFLAALAPLGVSVLGEGVPTYGVELGCKGQLRRQVRDPELRAKLAPTDEFGCKRVLWSNEWYPALSRPNVDVVTESVVEVLPHGVRSGDGVEHEVDVIIYGTGFAATEFLAPMQITGLDGADLHGRWKEGARAYLGLSVPDFPNLFVVYGPNTNLGGSSIINMLEAASGAITTLLTCRKRGTCSGRVAAASRVAAAGSRSTERNRSRTASNARPVTGGAGRGKPESAVASTPSTRLPRRVSPATPSA